MQDKPNVMFPLHSRPNARAIIRGSADHPTLRGTVDFYRMGRGVVVIASLWGLPVGKGKCANDIFALHIHAGKSCSGTAEEPFRDADGHFDPRGCPHPVHAGDLPPLFANRGYAWQGVYTERFTMDEILGRTVIVHSQRDDFSSQPAGDAGARIGCGVIRHPTGRI